MKFSKYNRIINIDGKYYIYNSISNTFSEINENLSLLLKKSKENEIDFQSVLPNNVLEELIKNKNVVDDDNYEILKIRNQIELYRKTGQKTHLTIAPTMDCDFNCYYCFESNHEYYKMDENTQDNIVNYIKIIPSLKDVHLTWFGGEPLLAMDIIKQLTKKIQLLDINYSANIITNGYNIGKYTLNDFKSLDIKDIQVTIDGPKEIHDNRRTHKVFGNSFDKIISNLKNLITQIKVSNDSEMRIVIRVNIDNENMNYYGELREYIINELDYSNLNITCGWVKYSSDRKVESYCITRPNDVLRFNNLYKDFNEIKRQLYPSNAIKECFARSYWSIVVDPKGNVYKCWEEIGVK